MQARDAEILEELEVALTRIKRLRLARQVDMARAFELDQPTVSRAAKGRLTAATPNLRRLLEYANMRLKEADDPVPAQPVDRALKRFRAVGGSEKDLVALVELATALLSRRR